jgi:hypothetical protein
LFFERYFEFFQELKKGVKCCSSNGPIVLVGDKTNLSIDKTTEKDSMEMEEEIISGEEVRGIDEKIDPVGYTSEKNQISISISISSDPKELRFVCKNV